MAPFFVSHVVPDDLPAINEISIAAFNHPNSLTRRIYSHQSDDEVIWRFKLTLFGYDCGDHSRWDKLVDEATGKVVAFTVWLLPRKKGSEEDEKARIEAKANIGKEFMKETKFPETANQNLLVHSANATEIVREAYVDKEKDYKFQGRGCGRQLMKHGLDIVDTAGARAALEATPQGKPLYERYGFREVNQMVLQLKNYGHEGTHITKCMIRDKQAIRKGGHFVD